MTSLYERMLGALGGQELPAEKPPRASAAVVPWRRRPEQGGGLEVFWVRRSPALAFMGGWHAFPGGGLARGDAALPTDGPPRGLPANDDLPGLAACALRELFEETGLLVSPGLGGDRAALAAARTRLLAEPQSLPALLAELGLRLDATRLVYAGRWLTPPLAPLRFDNRFFLLEWPAGREPQPEVLPGELESGEWIAPGAALRRCEEGETIAAPPILHLLRVLAEDGPEAGLPRLRDLREAHLGPFLRIEFRPGTLLFPLRTYTLPPAGSTNCLLVGGGEAVLVDPGSPHAEENERLLTALAETERRLGRKTVEIWLTHHHPDHVGGVAALRRELGVPVRAHPLTAARLAEQGIAVDGDLVEGSERRLDGESPITLRALHTPGHARGHLVFHDAERGTLVAGDLVAAMGTVVIDPPEGDMDEYLASLRRIRDLPLRTLFPGHGGAIAAPAHKLQEYLDHRAWREGRVLEAWRSGLRTPAAILPVVYDDAAPAALPLAERQVVAHLERLERQGALQ